MNLTVRPATPERWADLERFFGPSGAYSNCWCTFFRQKGKDFEAGCRNAGAGNRAMLERLTREGRVPGLLGYATNRPENGPVGWVSVAPREEFERLMRSPILQPDRMTEAGVWSVVCFWMPPANRGQGVARQLLDGAVRYAAEHDARIVEGYPVDTGGERKATSSLYTGTRSLFCAAGFHEVYRRTPNRPVMRYQLR